MQGTGPSSGLSVLLSLGLYPWILLWLVLFLSVSFTRDLAYILYSVVNVLAVFTTFPFSILRSAPESSQGLCGDWGTRTPGLCLAKAPLSRLS